VLNRMGQAGLRRDALLIPKRLATPVAFAPQHDRVWFAEERHGECPAQAHWPIDAERPAGLERRCGDRVVPAPVSGSQLLWLIGKQKARRPRGSRDAHDRHYPDVHNNSHADTNTNPDADARPGRHSDSDTSTTSAGAGVQGSGAEQPLE